MNREIQEKLLPYIKNKLNLLSGLKFESADINYLMPNYLYYILATGSNNTYVSFRFNPKEANLDDLDSIKLTTDAFTLGDITIEDVYRLIEAVKVISKEQFCVYLKELNYNFKVNNVVELLEVSKYPRGKIQISSSDFQKLITACKKGTLAVIHIDPICKTDSKYKDIIISRGAIHLRDDCYALIDVE